MRARVYRCNPGPKRAACTLETHPPRTNLIDRPISSTLRDDSELEVCDSVEEEGGEEESVAER
jgi:hypothetical protein